MRLFNLLFLVILISSCGEDATSEYEDAREQIIGSWDLSIKTETLQDGQIIHTSTIMETVSIDADGTGRRQNGFLGIQDFEWIYQLDPEKIAIATTSSETNSGFLALGEDHIFDVIQNNESLQQWIANDKIITSVDTTLLIADRVTEWQMTR